MAEEHWTGQAASFVDARSAAIGPGLAGVALASADGRFRIELRTEAGEVALALGPFCETEVIALWRAIAGSSGLPLLVEENGRVAALFRQIGRLVVGRRPDRSRLAVLSGRRPRFLTRRKTGRLPARPDVVDGAELASGSAR